VLITVAGLPAHPLLVHAAVVLIPLAALGTIAIAVRAPWRRTYGPLVAVGAVLAALAGTGAVIAGNQLQAVLAAQNALGDGIDQHGQWGTYTMYAVWPFAVLTVVAVVLARRGPAPAHAVRGTAVATTSTAATVVTWLAAVAAVVALVLVVLTGDSGSRAVWSFVTGG
jgi:hypothetical protein